VLSAMGVSILAVLSWLGGGRGRPQGVSE